MRNKPLRFALAALGLVLACGVGAILWRSALRSMEDEFYLKCENRKEVSSLARSLARITYTGLNNLPRFNPFSDLESRSVQILKSDLENNLNASFLIIGLVASVPDLDETIWRGYCSQTLFLRSNVKRLVYMERVLQSERAAFERKWNGSISYVKGNVSYVRGNDTEYSPIVFGTADDVPFTLVDPAAYPVLASAIYAARDTGLFTLSPATGAHSSWSMGAYLAYYGPGRDGSSFSTVEERRQACLGYVGTMLNVSEIFADVLSRLEPKLP
jgi:histidine kinase 2/3/4 (cytokinin receptor)